MAESVDYLIVGAGFAGAVCARQLAEAGQSVLVIDQRAHVGGNAFDRVNSDGILVHQYGAHIFHTNSPVVMTFLSRFTQWRPYVHRVLSSVNGVLVPMPINRTTLAHFKGNQTDAIKALITPYTAKQWGPYADDLSASVFARIKARDTDDDRYFTDNYQVMPADGYTPLFRRLLNHEQIRLATATSYQHWLEASSWLPRATRIIWTGPIDQYFEYCFRALPYRSASFEFVTYDTPQLQSVGVVNYPSSDVPFTRAIEFKHLTGQAHPKTTLAFETPQAHGDPFWPVPTEESAALYQEYRALAAATAPHVFFLGRLGRFHYLDMHQVVAQALSLTHKLIRGDYADAAA